MAVAPTRRTRHPGEREDRLGARGTQPSKQRRSAQAAWVHTDPMPAETIPILPSAEFDLTASFWSDFGFVEIGRWPDYLIVRHDGFGIELHFWLDRSVDRWTNDVACYIRFGSPEEAVACHAGWADVAVPEPARLSAPMAEPWGAVEFHVIDLHGNLVRLGGFPQPAGRSRQVRQG